MDSDIKQCEDDIKVCTDRIAKQICLMKQGNISMYNDDELRLYTKEKKLLLNKLEFLLYKKNDYIQQQIYLLSQFNQIIKDPIVTTFAPINESKSTINSILFVKYDKLILFVVVA